MWAFIQRRYSADLPLDGLLDRLLYSAVWRGTSGWREQWDEMILDTEQKIARLRQIYIGTSGQMYEDRLTEKFPKARTGSIRK